MAGETLVSANSDTGVYLLIDNSSWVTNNLPGNCKLGGDDGLVLGTGYMYFNDFLSLARNTTSPSSDSIIGWSFAQDGNTYLKTNASTGQGIFTHLEVNVLVTSTQQQNFEKFFDLHQATKPAISGFQLYLVRQWASTTFKQFSYNAGLKKYIAVVLTDYDMIEVSQQGFDGQNLRIGFIHAYRLNTG